ncbi:hypothetical protein [Candidatus Magnetobacterium casense]|uniref:hypothetical protein n=1 Tax=Candidatus Magnetobacterium casense TaxID=1455061 RepID=UPI00058FAFEA|nr:hypothetical protein [Candidatus Magnetobacterium casensis]
MKHIRNLKAQASVATIVPMLLAVSIIFGMGYLLLSKTPHVQALVYVPALITLGSCVLYFWLTVLDNNRTKQQISEYLRLMNHYPPSGMESQVQAESETDAETDAQTNLAYVQANLETIIALLEQSNRLAASAVNKELILSVRETIDEGLKKHANTIHQSNSQHVEYIISSINEIFFTNLKPGIDAIVCGLNSTDDKQTDSQTTIQQLVSAIDGMKSFKDDIVTELAKLPEALNATPLQYSQDIKAVIEQLQLLPEQMRSTYTKLTTYLSSAINEIQGLYADGFEQISKLSAHSTMTQENFEKLIERINTAIEKQLDTFNDTVQAAHLVNETASVLATTSSDIRLLTDGLLKETEGISKLNSQLLEKQQSTFREFQDVTEKVLINLVHQADAFTGRTTEGLRQFIDDIVSSLSKTAGTMENQRTRLLEWTDSIDQHMGKLSTHSALTQENFERLMIGITSAIDKQADTLKDSAQVVGLIKESVTLLATTSGDISLLTDGLVKSTDSHDRLYVSFNDLFKETEGISKLNSQLFEKHQATFKELEGTIEKVLTNLVHQADVFTGRTTDGLRQFIDDIVSSLSKTTNTMENQHTRLLEWTNSIDQHVGKLSIHSALTQENFERLMAIITNAVDKQADTLKDSAQVVERIKESADLLATASGDVRLLADGLVKSTDSQQRLCVNFNDLFKETEGISKLNSQLFEKHQATFKELEDTIEKVMTNLVHQADVFTGRTTDGLKQFIDDIASSLSKTVGTVENQHTRLLEWTISIDQHVGKLSTHSVLTQENFERLMAGITNAVDKQADTLKDSARVVGLIKESAALLAIASGDVRLLTDGLAKSTGSQEQLCVNFNDLFKEIEGISKLNSRLLEKQQSTFKELEGTIEKVMTNLVVQTDVFTARTTDRLKQFIDDITSNLSKTSGSIDSQTAKFMDWTSSIDQHISKLSAQHTVSQDGLKQLINLINSSIERQNNTLEKSSKLVSLIKESAVLLATASTGVKHLTEGLIKSADTHEKLYANFNSLLKEADGKSKLNTQLLEHERDTFKELAATVERLLFNLVKQTDVFTGRTTDGLTRFINDINAGLSESVSSLRGVIHVQTELVDEISSTLVQLNDKLKG